ncbi:hypothetical protein N1851_021682 [Merluccius polli]|uniref:Uncharacterized protein n=1 Tax=Merluccius polli TaxID=89951 RepID=A0AA47NWJ3_MERPO|nr:hypothetical protein N1851_021682 [Merluccius polli]
MNAGKEELKVKRVSTRKRTRDSLNSNLTPAKKRGTGPEKGMLNGLMADEHPPEYCSDNEDLFGDYDSILGDSSVMAKLDCVEQIARKQEPQQAVDSRPVDSRPVDSRPVDSRAVGSRAVDSRAVDSRPVDTRPLDSRPVDRRPVDQPQTGFTELRLQRHSDDRLTDSILDVFKDKSFEDLPGSHTV